MTTDHAARCRIDRVVRLVVFVVVAGLAAVVARVAQLQLSPGPELAAHLHEPTSRRPLLAIRGDVVDRRGRPVAVTRFGYRVFVDPERFPQPADEAIGQLAAAIGQPADEIGERIISAMAANAQRRVARAPGVQHPAEDVLSRARQWLASLAGSERIVPSQPGGDGAPRLIRYVPLGGMLEDREVAAVRALGMSGVHLERRQVREYPGRDELGALAGKVGAEHRGLLGVELAFDEQLRGVDGAVEYVRDARGRPLWVERGGFSAPRRGSTVRLSIDLALQRMAREELWRGVDEAGAAGGRLVMVDPASGEVLAMVDVVRPVPEAEPFPWEPFDAAAPSPGPVRAGVRYQAIRADDARAQEVALGRVRCLEEVYEPGSTFKPFVWAVLTDRGLVGVEEVLETGGGQWRTPYGRVIRDVVARDRMSWPEVLVHSSNIGMARAVTRIGSGALHDAIRAFGFGEPTGLGIAGEAPGLVTPKERWTSYTQTSVAFGYEVGVTPVQLARAFCVFARRGALEGTLPQLTLQAEGEQVQVSRRVVSAATVGHVCAALEEVARRLDEKLSRRGEGPWSVTMFGKSGTANVPLGEPPAGYRRPRGHRGYLEGQYVSSFVAAAPADRPRLVVVVVIEDPAPELVRARRHFGSDVAGPVVRRVVERAMAYLEATSLADAR